MIKKIFLSLSFLLVLADAGTLKGKVSYEGRPFKMKPMRMGADPVCGASHSGKVRYDGFKMSNDGYMEEALVWLKNVKYSGDVPSEPVILDQKGCVYTPHVIGAMAGQELLIKNSDATLHNIHSMPKVNKEFNFAMPKVVKEKKASFAKSEPDPFYIKCDVHPWMKAWVLVTDHPYYAITDKDGNYEIPNIPPGTYEVLCWQEQFVKKDRYKKTLDKVTIGAGETIKDFVLKGPPKK